MTHDIHEKHDFKGPWDNYGKESTDSRRKDVVSGAAIINNAREAQRHQDVEAGGQGERRGGAPSREA